MAWEEPEPSEALSRAESRACEEEDIEECEPAEASTGRGTEAVLERPGEFAADMTELGLWVEEEGGWLGGAGGFSEERRPALYRRNARIGVGTRLVG